MTDAFGQRDTLADYIPIAIPASYVEYRKQTDEFVRRMFSATGVGMAGSSLTSEFQARMKREKELAAIKRILTNAGIR